MQFTHITVSVTINEEDRAWGNPNGSESLSFSVPSELFDATKISKLFPSIIKVAEERFKLEKQKYELENEGE
jgi:hypothetical protein